MPDELIVEAPKPAEEIKTEEKPLTDTMSSEEFRTIRRIQRNRGGVQARIDNLTKEKRALEVQLNPANIVPNQSPLPPPVVPEAPKIEVKAPEPPPPEPPKVVPSTNERPKSEDFTSIDDFQAEMALWAAKQVAPPPPTVDLAAEQARLKSETELMSKFKTQADEFAKVHPDWHDSLIKAGERGLNLAPAAQATILALDNGAAVAYWLSRPENEASARALMQMGPIQQAAQVGKLAGRIEGAPDPRDFVSGAPAPIPRLIGGNTQSTVSMENLPMQDFRRIRKQQRRGL